MSREDALLADLKGYDASFNEHMNKVHDAMHGNDVNSILGWLNDCRHFADKAFETATHLVELGGSFGQDISALHADRINHIEQHREEVRQYLRKKDRGYSIWE